MVAFNRCMDCKFAEWDRTAKGHLHPGKLGWCNWTKKVALPACIWTHEAERLNRELNRRRRIDRGSPFASCDTFVRAGDA